MVSTFFAQKAFVLHEDCLLAVRRSAADANQPLRWEVPGGRLEAGEELDHHLTREVLEETGVTVTPGEPFYVWKWRVKRQRPASPNTVVAVARLCSAKTNKLSARGRVRDDNLDLMRWIPLARLREYDWIPNMLPVLEAFIARLAR